jgi:phosphoribosylamine--glycine ligase
VAYLESLPGPWVIKTDGLAAGKGVLVAQTMAEARADVEAKLSGSAFGEAGRRIVIEEGLAGEECSLLVLYDGTTAVPLVPAQDFKRIGDGDRGPNTGGMGAYAPMPHVSPAQVDDIMATRWSRCWPPCAARHRLPRRALRRPHAGRRGAQGH